jgi:hypothetical protein
MGSGSSQRNCDSDPITDHGFIVKIKTEEPFEGLIRSIDVLKTVEIED